MTIFELGALGELIGAILLFGSLIFVGLQIGQNSSSVKAAAVQAVLENLNLSIQVGAASRETAKVIVKGQIDFESLDEDEQFQFSIWVIFYFRSLELAHQHYLAGALSSSMWKGVEGQISSLLAAESVLKVWAVRRQSFGDEFASFIDSFPKLENHGGTKEAVEIVLS